MVDGCNLYVSEEDVRQIAANLDRPHLIDEVSPPDLKPSQIREMLETVSRDKIVKILEDPSKPAARAMGRLLMTATDAQHNLNPEDARRIPDAFRDIFKDQPSALGVFVRPAGPRGHGGSGILHGAEALAAQALMRGEFTTSTGDHLRINPPDRLDFGLKHASEFVERKRGGTIEADILIHRGAGFVDLPPIGIDVKYSKTGQYGVKPELPSNLKKIRNALSDGQLNRFVFVTQGEFTEEFNEKIGEVNRDLLIDWMFSKGEEVEWNHLKSADERGPLPNLDPLAIDELDPDDILALAGKYGIPVIETCEHVSVTQ